MPKHRICTMTFAGMPKSRPAIVGLAAASVLASCSPPPIDIAIHNIGGETVIGMSQQWGLFARVRAPCVHSLTLYAGNTEVGKPVWKVEGADVGDLCVHNVGSVKMGKTPRGFSTVHALALLKSGQYTLVVSGLGDGKTNFTIS